MSWNKKKGSNDSADLEKQLEDYIQKEKSWKEKEKNFEEALLVSKAKVEELAFKIEKVVRNSKLEAEDGSEEDSKSKQKKTDDQKLISQLNVQLKFEHNRREEAEKRLKRVVKSYRNIAEEQEWNEIQNNEIHHGFRVDLDNRSNAAKSYIERLYQKRQKNATLLSNKLILLSNKLEDLQLLNHSNRLNDLIDEINDIKEVKLPV